MLWSLKTLAADPHDSMSYREMATVMQMDDTAAFGKVMLDQLEWRDDGARAAWDVQARYGDDYNKLWVKTEGREGGGPAAGVRDASAELLWDRVVSPWWSVQTGVRQNFGPGQGRTWLAVGLEGLAPQWFQTDATLYISDGGRAAARLKTQYDLLLTQRLVLQPYAEANLYARTDARSGTGRGVSDLELSARLRYELRRELAPYVGVVWSRRFGASATFARTAGEDVSGVGVVVGLRAWF